MPRILPVTWDDLQSFNEQKNDALERFRACLLSLCAEPGRFSVRSLLAMLFGPYGPPTFRRMPATVGHLIYRLTDALDESARQFTYVHPVKGGCTVEEWRAVWQLAYTNAKGQSTIPLVLGTPPVLPCC